MSFIGQHPQASGDPGRPADPGQDHTGAARHTVHPQASSSPYADATGPRWSGSPDDHQSTLYPNPYAVPSPYAQPAYVTKPRNQLPWAVVGLIICLPLGLAALFFNARIEPKWSKGDVIGAVNDARLTRTLGIASLALGIFWWVAAGIFMAVFLSLGHHHF